jgi:hypothetical protein
MIPWQHLDTAKVPGDGGELKLMRRGTEYSIMAGAIELMNSRLSGSEEAMATLAFERIGQRTKARVLIGGLGMGFTLRAALAAFGPTPGSSLRNWCRPSSPGPGTAGRTARRQPRRSCA